jgi:uncharacterized protein
MTDTERRAFAATVEIRGGSVEERIIEGRVVPYGETTRPESGLAFVEQFAPGAFARSARERGDRIKLLTSHDLSALPIGRSVGMSDRPDGLHGAFKVARTPRGDEALALAADGALDAFSVGFVVPPGGDTWARRGGERTIREARLMEVSVVTEPAYAGAQITSVRSVLSPADELDLWARRLRLLTHEGHSR